MNSVSVVIPSYNSAKFLPEAIESVLAQTYPVFEIIVVDDGSTDETKDVCSRYPTVKYVYQSNQGVSVARNLGIRSTQGEYLLFLDSDDCLLPKAVEISVNCINAHPEVGFVFGRFMFQTINPNGSYKTEEIYENQPEVASYATLLAAKHKIQSACILFRRIAVESEGGFNPSLKANEDIDFFLRVARRSPIYFHNEIVSEYRYNGGNVSGKPVKMLIGAVNSHNLQWSYVEQTGNKEYEMAFEYGKQSWIKLFVERLPYEVMKYIQDGNWISALGTCRLILSYDPKLEYVDRSIYESCYEALLSQLRTLPIKPSLAYWKQQLADVQLLSLSTDHPRPPQPSHRGAQLTFELSKALTDALKQLSQQTNTTLFMTLLAAFKTLLYRYTQQDDIAIGSPIVNHNDYSDVFVNAVVLRTDMSGNPSFRKLLGQVRKVVLTAEVHQDVPFEILAEELHLPRDLSYSPLFQVMFALEEDVSLQKNDVSSVTASPWVLENNEGKFDLTLFFEKTSNELLGKWLYNTDLFDADTVERMNEHFQILLESIVAGPERPISELTLLTEKEKQQLIVGWNNTNTEYPQDRCIHHWFEEQVEQAPNAVAVLYENQQLTYQELNNRANQLANHLVDLGVRPDALVGICVERSLEMLVGILGILKAGGAYVPLDPAYPKERLAFMLEDSQLSVLLSESNQLAELPAHKARVVCLDTDWGIIAQQKEENLNGGVTPNNLAYTIYTSGSTGKPKGVQVLHRGVVNFLLSMSQAPGLTHRDVLLAVTTISFDIAVLELYLPLVVGARVVLVSREAATDANLLLKALAQSGATVMQATPATWRMLLAAGWQGDQKLKILCGGEAMPRDLANQLLDRSASLWNMYGPTETTVWSAVYQVQPGDQPIPIGRPIANTQIYLADPSFKSGDNSIHLVPVGEPGELLIGGIGLARGYLNRPQLTDEKFIPDPFSEEPEARLYRTGDLARYLPDSNIEFIGRIDHQVKIRGFRIELGEIESALSQHREVQQCVVIAREDEPGNKRLVAYVVTAGSEVPTSREFRQYLQQTLPDYMLPAAFVSMESLPLTPNGKINRRALPRPDSHLASSTDYVSPRTPVEQALAQIWADVLQLEAVGIHDNFFELGGDSLIAVRLLTAMEKTFGKNLPLSVFFKAQTVEQLASFVRQDEQSATWQSLVMIQPGGSKPPFFCIHANWGNVLFYRKLMPYLEPDRPFYGLQAQGLDGKQAPRTSVVEMAAQYIKEIQSVQPKGPYFLGGLSFGGLVAFEIAQQLYLQGQEIAIVALIDTETPAFSQPNSKPSDVKPLTLWSRIFFHFSKLLRLGLKDQVTYLWERLAWHVAVGKLSILNRIYLHFIKRSPQDLALLNVARASILAYRSYQPQVYPGRLTLLRAIDRDLGSDDDPKLGWGGLSTDIEIHQITGSHITLMEEPNVKLLAEKLTNCLNQVQII